MRLQETEVGEDFVVDERVEHHVVSAREAVGRQTPEPEVDALVVGPVEEHGGEGDLESRVRVGETAGDPTFGLVEVSHNALEERSDQIQVDKSIVHDDLTADHGHARLALLVFGLLRQQVFDAVQAAEGVGTGQEDVLFVRLERTEMMVSDGSLGEWRPNSLIEADVRRADTLRGRLPEGSTGEIDEPGNNLSDVVAEEEAAVPAEGVENEKAIEGEGAAVVANLVGEDFQ